MGDDRRPVLIGAGQVTLRHQRWPDLAGPLDLCCEAVGRAVADTGASGGLLARVDHLTLVNMASWDYGDAPAAAAAALGLDERAELVELPIGGNTPQQAINALARRLAAGELELALLAGGEAFAAKRAARAAGERVDWGRVEPARPAPEEADPSHPLERAAQAVAPSTTYPMWEPALRVAAGRTPEQHRAFLGELMAGYTSVAAGNPHAWFPEVRTPDELMTVGEGNRMVATPYPKLVNAMMRVDQGAALLLTTVGTARALGVPAERWVHLLGGGDCQDRWWLSERVAFDHSPGMRAVAAQTWASSGLGPGDVAHADVYACFPSAVQLAAEAYGLDLAGPPPTVTGGLAYAGGPGNDYVTHAVATMVERLRAAPGEVGLVTGLGWHVTKHSAGLYAAGEPPGPWAPVDPAPDQAAVLAAAHPVVDPAPDGPASIEAYTVLHDRDGTPVHAPCLARLDEGRRAVVWSDDPDTVRAMAVGEWFGASVRVRPDGRFWL